MSDLQLKLKAIFQDFIQNQITDDRLVELKSSLELHQINVLLDDVMTLGHPEDYCKNDYDTQTVDGFFLYIDFISALLINLNINIDALSAYQNSKNSYIQWILRYVNEPRFHSEIMAKFSKIF